MVPVLVTGGTGTLGRAVVARLVAAHYQPRILSRQPVLDLPNPINLVTGDLVTEHGLREAVTGVHAIIHCATAPQDAAHVDIAGTRALLREARARGAPHIIYPSIVGVSQSAYPYYQAKYAAEGLIKAGSLPWTIVRVTQFHDLVLQLMQSFGADTTRTVVVVAGLRFQSIDVGEVADQLVQIVQDGPVGHMPALGGPQVRTLEEMTEAYLRIRGRQATIRSEERELFTTFKTGINLVPERAVGRITWEDFLQRRYGDE